MTILATIGGEHERDRVVDIGHDLATVYDDDLVVLHVMAEAQFEKLRSSQEITEESLFPGLDEEAVGIMYRDPTQSLSGYDLEQADTDAASVAQECVAQTVPSGSGVAVSAKGRVGDPAEEIVAEADRLDARYIVVGGRKRSPAGKALFGSTSQSVILNSDRPVVAINRAR